MVLKADKAISCLWRTKLALSLLMSRRMCSGHSRLQTASHASCYPEHEPIMCLQAARRPLNAWTAERALRTQTLLQRRALQACQRQARWTYLQGLRPA